jgi:uncharacterized HAD superfamily protein
VKNYLIDIDGTITEDVPNEEMERMSEVAPFPGVVDTIRSLYEGGDRVTFFTSRTEDMRSVTETWLAKWGFSYHALLMGKPRGGNYVWIDNLNVTYLNYPRDVVWEEGLMWEFA